MYLLLDNENVVRCMASEECNLHKDKIVAGMQKVEATFGGVCGDKYFPETKTWEAHPENYPQPGENEKNEKLIQEEITRIQREEAIDKLISEGKLPPDYKESYAKNKTKKEETGRPPVQRSETHTGIRL